MKDKVVELDDFYVEVDEELNTDELFLLDVWEKSLNYKGRINEARRCD